jgi:hypothetical protein
MRTSDGFYFLHEIAKDPLIAVYVTSLNLWDQREEPSAREESGAWTEEENLQAIKVLIEERVAGYMEKTDELDVDDWWEEVRDEILHFNPDPAQVEETFGMFGAVTLLAMLPNLQELTLHPAWPGRIPARMYTHTTLDFLETVRAAPGRWDKVSIMLKNMTLLARASAKERTLSNSDGSRVQFWPLAKLDTLLPSDVPGLHQQPSLTSLEPFLLLPNLQNLYSVSATSESYRWLIDWENRLSVDGVLGIPTTSVQLRRLEIVYGGCTHDAIGGLLTHCHRLEVFKYAHEEKYMRGDFDAKELVNLVGKSVGKTLKEFAVRTLELNECLQVVENFEGFVVLEELELDVRLFNDYWENYDNVGPLSSMLPPSTRNVILNLDNQPTLLPTLRKLLEGLAQARHTDLPRLESISVCAQESVEDEQRRKVRLFAEEQGVEWAIPQLEPYQWHRIGWVEDFCNRFDIQ